MIYFIEGNSDYQEKLEKVFKLNDDGFFKFITSSITLLEVLVNPLKDGETKIVDQYKTISPTLIATTLTKLFGIPLLMRKLYNKN